MEVTLLLNFRGKVPRTTKDNKTYFLYNFEDEYGMSVQFSSSNDLAFEKDKTYKLLFNASKLFFKGVSK